MTLTTNIYLLLATVHLYSKKSRTPFTSSKQFFMFVYRFLKTDFFCHFDKSCKTGYVLILR
jgi:hypothetical protein